HHMRCILNITAVRENGKRKFLKCMMVGKDTVVDDAIKHLNPKYYEAYSVVRSAPIFLEFLNKSTNKGTALEALAAYLKIEISETMAIGDAGNDLAMIEMAGIGVAMENSFPEVKKVANFITTSNEDSGVAKALNKFVNLK
ncbi:MAG: HAD-IIB family hydrolase, partial [Anaeroplasmataceae bacterium]|nr:HAD-IIB family hydrolase [Anaeroplasmataceae bacterium]